VYDYLNMSGTFVIGSLTNDSAPVSAGGPNPLSNAQIGQIGALVENGDTLVGAPPSGYTANDVGAAIQLAIWQVEYPTFSYSWAPAEANADALAAIYYADATAGAGDWTAYYGIAALSELDNQTQIVDFSTQNLDPAFTSQGLSFLVPQVPEPSTWAMIMVGFAGHGVAGFHRCRRGMTADRARGHWSGRIVDVPGRVLDVSIGRERAFAGDVCMPGVRPEREFRFRALGRPLIKCTAREVSG
jgi:hypothetical protein